MVADYHHRLPTSLLQSLTPNHEHEAALHFDRIHQLLRTEEGAAVLTIDRQQIARGPHQNPATQMFRLHGWQRVPLQEQLQCHANPVDDA